MKLFVSLSAILLLVVTSCSSNWPNKAIQTPTPAITISFEKTKDHQEMKIITPTVMSSAVPIQIPTATKFAANVCSPLSDTPIDNLIHMISNPFYPPKTGSDDPHQGVDFSIMDPDLRIAMKGASVQAILEGEVVMVMKDRFPYGNAVLVETAFQDLPPGWAEKLAGLSAPELFNTNTTLTCPSGWDELEEPNQELSLLILYAHLENPPQLLPGDQVGCGNVVGAIGDSGNALAPHLHIEMRYGYSAGIEGSMAHYDVSADEQEMSNYCRWRVSGWYRTIDPMDMFSVSVGTAAD